MNRHEGRRRSCRSRAGWGVFLVLLVVVAAPVLCREASGQVTLEAWALVCCAGKGEGYGPQASTSMLAAGCDSCWDTPVAVQVGQIPAVVSAKPGASWDVVPPPTAFVEQRTAAFLLPPCRAWRTVCLLI